MHPCRKITVTARHLFIQLSLQLRLFFVSDLLLLLFMIEFFIEFHFLFLKILKCFQGCFTSIKLWGKSNRAKVILKWGAVGMLSLFVVKACHKALDIFLAKASSWFSRMFNVEEDSSIKKKNKTITSLCTNSKKSHVLFYKLIVILVML